MHSLRKPWYLAALVLFGFALSLEAGSFLGLGARPPSGAALLAAMEEIARTGPPPLQDAGEIAERTKELIALSRKHDAPPGRAIAHLALLDLLVFVSVLFLGAGLLIRTRNWGRIQSALSAIVALVVLAVSVLQILAALALLLTMTGLFLAAPFGTLAYLAIYGFFPRAAAAALLSSALLLKLASGACLLVAQQRILFVKMLVALFLTSLAAGALVSFLHGVVPLPLVSIADSLAALLVGVVAAAWGLLLLVLSLPALVRGLA